jgi:hypothetical protein
MTETDFTPTEHEWGPAGWMIKKDAPTEDTSTGDWNSVTVYGADSYRSHLLPQEMEVSQELLREFERELKELLDYLWDTYEEKGALYEQATPVWHHFVFGLVSFASQVSLKATRFVSLLQSRKDTPLSEIEDTLRDLTVYSWYAWAYARLISRAASEDR